MRDLECQTKLSYIAIAITFDRKFCQDDLKPIVVTQAKTSFTGDIAFTYTTLGTAIVPFLMLLFFFQVILRVTFYQICTTGLNFQDGGVKESTMVELVKCPRQPVAGVGGVKFGEMGFKVMSPESVYWTSYHLGTNHVNDDGPGA
uniref:Uncharacterized protein n=1 Tax=Salix viminalis TaxID=40686 RepID=A0A6N2NKA7_SALVM